MTRSKSDVGFGFREIQAFNLALLRKMAAQLLADPSSLWAQVLKGIYFPHSAFIAAVKGGRPSWAWHSLLAGRDSVIPGAVWVVGHGKSIRPFSNAWIPGHYDSRIGLHPITDHQANTYLEEWIDQSGRAWKEDSVRGAVSDQEAQQVLSVPIPMLPKLDELKWPFEKQGTVSARSAYHLIRSRYGEGESGNSSPGGGHQPHLNMWHAIWKSKLLPKVKKIAWKLASNVLAVREVLAKRGLQVSPACPLCGISESVEHLVWECEWVKNVWEELLGLQQVQDGCNSVIEWLSRRSVDCVANMGQSEKRWNVILTGCWSIWKARCAWAFQGKSPSIAGVGAAVRKVVT